MEARNLEKGEAKIALNSRLGSIKIAAEKMRQSIEVIDALEQLAKEYKVGPHLLAEYLELAEDSFLPVPGEVGEKASQHILLKPIGTP